MQHQQFLDAFVETFAERWSNTPDAAERFHRSSSRTQFMLGGGHPESEEGVLPRAARKWADRKGLGSSGSSIHQWYTLDLLLVSPAYSGEGRYWTTRSILALEHENGFDIETELWKLAHWRSDLSLLVFYDFSEAECLTDLVCEDPVLPGVTKKNWLTEKLKKLSEIVRLVDLDRCDRHLLLIGRKAEGGANDIAWRFSCWRQDGFCAPERVGRPNLG